MNIFQQSLYSGVQTLYTRTASTLMNSIKSRKFHHLIPIKTRPIECGYIKWPINYFGINWIVTLSLKQSQYWQRRVDHLAVLIGIPNQNF